MRVFGKSSVEEHRKEGEINLYSVERVLVKLKVKNRHWCLERDMDYLVNRVLNCAKVG